MPKSAFRTISRDHHSPMESSERAAGHRSCLNDLRRMLRLTLLSKVVAPLYQHQAYYMWFHYETTCSMPDAGIMVQLLLTGALDATCDANHSNTTCAPRHVHSIPSVNGGPC